MPFRFRQLRRALLPCRRLAVAPHGAMMDWIPDLGRVKYQIMILYADEIGAISRK